MLKYLTILISISIAYLDYLAYNRIVKDGVPVLARRLFASFAIVANLLPVISPLFMYVLMNDENEGIMMKISMTMFTIFITLLLSRMVFYLFWFTISRKWGIYTGITFSSIIFSLLLYSAISIRTDYRVRQVEIEFKNLPLSFDGYRIVFISDIHIGSMFNSQDEIKKIADMVESIDADVVMFGGDLINLSYRELSPEILEQLSRFNKKENVISVLGNHDTGIYIKDSINTPRTFNISKLDKAVSSIGWRLLRDSTLYLYKGCDSIAVTGIDYTDKLLGYKHSFRHPDDYCPDPLYTDVDSDIFNITLSHLPQLWRKIYDGRYSDLTLSGHVHAFQFKLILFGIELSPAKAIYSEWSGLYGDDKGKLYVTDGTGTVGFFARLGAYPEITVIELKKEYSLK